MTDNYILRGREAVPEPCLLAWGRWMQTADRRVARDRVEAPDWSADVSTVFLGLNHSFGDGPPVLFETMVFGGPLDGEQDRYHTWDGAEAGHRAMLLRVQEAARQVQ